MYTAWHGHIHDHAAQRVYVIEAINVDGSRKPIGQYPTEKVALQCLAALREIAADHEREAAARLARKAP